MMDLLLAFASDGTGAAFFLLHLPAIMMVALLGTALFLAVFGRFL